MVVCLLAAAFSSFAQRQVIDKVIATVGGELVLLSEIEEQRSLIQAQQGNLPENASCLILDNILAQKLLVNQAKLDSIEVGEEEVEAQLDARIEQILAYMNGSFEQFEAYYGQTVNEVKEQFREDLRNQLLAERMRGQVMTGIAVTPSEVKSFFARIPTDSLPYFDAEVEVGELALRPEVNAEQRKIALDKLAELRERIVDGGEDFAALAQTFSDDFGSGRIGGDLGWSTRGKFVPEFEAAAYSLEDGEISEPVETEFGFHIIQLLERRGNSIHCRHILVKPEITQEDLEKTAAKLDSIRNLIQTDSLSFSIAVKRFGFKDVQSFNNDGRMVNPKTGNTFFEIGDLDPDVYFTIDTMDVGTVSQAFQFRAQNGEILYRIVELQSQTNPHKANLEQDYSKIRAAAIEEKTSQFLSEWIEDTAYSTFIQIDPLFVSCEILSKWQPTQRP